MPKPPPKNGYFYYMQDYRREEERAGRRFPGGNKEVADAASDGWKRLTQQERDDYNKYAKENRHLENGVNVSRSSKDKKNAMGVSLAVIERERKEKEFREAEINTFVHEFVESMSIDDLRNKDIHLIHVNFFCKTDDDTYYPAEVAILKFNMKHGPVDTYHTFLDPGDIKKGYSSDVKIHSEKTHRMTLQLVKSHPGSREFEKIYNNIVAFLELKTKKSVPLFTMYDDVFQNTSLFAVEKTLETLWDSKHSTRGNDVTWRKYFPVYPLPLLFTEFKNQCYHRIGENFKAFPNSSIAITELNTDAYNFRDEFACKFHQDEDAVAFCSRSYVWRWAQIMRDHCCEPLNITIHSAPTTDDGSYGSTPLEYEYGTAASLSGRNDNNDSDNVDCQSVYSSVSTKTNMTVKTECSIGYGPKGGPGDTNTARSNATQLNRAGSSVWHGGSRSGQVRGAPTMDNANFPALGGLGRGMRHLRLQ